MTQVQKLIEVKAKSAMRFQAALGKPITLEQATELATKEVNEMLKQDQRETWVDITTGKRVREQH